MNNWWKAPVLQGEDNDYGQYDYLIEEIPQDYARWEFDRKYKWACRECGRESHLLFCSEHYFHTLDGYDSMYYSECWRCRLKDKMKSIKWKLQKNFKRRVETVKMTVVLYKAKPVVGIKRCYELAKKIVR